MSFSLPFFYKFRSNFSIRTQKILQLIWLGLICAPVMANASKIPSPKGAITIGVAKEGWAPFEFVEQNQAKGYLVEYLELAAANAGLNINWEVVEDRAAQLKAAEEGHHDLLIYGSKVDAYNEDYMFGKVVLPRYIAAFSRPSSKIDWAELEQNTHIIIASPKDQKTTSDLKTRFPNIRLLETNSVRESLSAVALGNADVTFADIAVGRYSQQKYLIPNLKVKPAIKEVTQLFKPVHILYQKSLDKELIQRLENGREAITNSQLAALRNKWIVNFFEQPKAISLTEQERVWLATAPTINVHTYSNFPPFSYEKNGQIIGYSIDYFRLLASKLGLNVTFDASHSWSEMLILAEERKLDVLNFLRYRESIDDYMDFSHSYYEGAPSLLYSRESKPKINALTSITDQTIAVQRGHLEHTYLLNNYPDINTEVVDSIGEGINAILRGDADYFICIPMVCNTYMFKNFITNVSVKGNLGIKELDQSQHARLAIRSDWPYLLSSLNKAIEAVSREELNNLRKKWFTESTTPLALKETLTQEEQDWLERNPRLAYSSPLKSAPFGYFDSNGELKGVAKDIVATFAAKFDLDTHVERFSSWSETYNALVEGEIDFMPGVIVTPERKQQLLFTNPTYTLDYVIHTQLGERLFNEIDELEGYKVGVVKGGGIGEILKKNHPSIQLVEYLTLENTILALSKGQVDAIIENPVIVQYHVDSLGLSNLKSTGKTKYSMRQAIAVHPSKPELVSLLNKTLAHIGSDQLQLMTEKWSNVRFIQRDEWKNRILWLVGIALVMTSLMLTFIHFNRRATLSKMQKITAQLENAQRVAKLGSCEIAIDNKMHNFSPEACRILGVAHGVEISNIDYLQMIDERDRERYSTSWSKALKTGLINVEYRLKVNESSKWLNEVVELRFDDNGKLQSGSAILQDISLFKATQDSLINQQDELRELTSKLLHVQEEERRRVARELHDDLTQRLAAIAIDAGTFMLTLQDETQKSALMKIKQSLVEVADDTHSLSRRLHPSILDQLGLVDALRSEVDSYQQREGIKVELFCSVKRLALAKDDELAIFRIVQEALRNIAKYSEASRVHVSFTVMKDTLILQVSDDGMGFDVEEERQSPGLGLKSMMERARLIGGELVIESEINKGCTIELHVPGKVNLDTRSKHTSP
ncbi:transporter substrate-binding domain-containing protein [Agarivorans aestuarii]|uniref:transporter substrate-binding domain-containing protein n=1 Tax=Agarivorans aestuarii TaxID=1563703 RepID=UPI001C7F0A97|nr:transporter substrate-binding domain-containing protein [Agarivorans aestuarii]